MPKPPIIGFAAFSGTGKTTLLEKLIPLLTNTGLNIGLVKASHHDIEPDQPGKDSYRLRKAGACQLVLSTPRRSICYTEYPEGHQRQLEQQLQLLDLNHLDLVVVEGFRDAPIPKIELHRMEYDKPFLFEQDKNIIALAWNGNPDSLSHVGKLKDSLPLLDINQPEDIAHFIMNNVIQTGRQGFIHD